MKKYRLIREYPGSPKLGTKIFNNEIFKGHYYVCDKGIIIHLGTIEPYKHPEFWEEVVEDNNPLNLVLGKTYKIRYKFCTSPIKICKVDRFTQHGYPWSNSLGGIITDSYELIEEVVEKDYEILSFKRKDSYHLFTLRENGNYFLEGDDRFNPNGYFCGLPESYHLNYGYVIYQVKRLSDGEIFTIGDKTPDGNITKFEISNDLIVFISNVTWRKLDLLYKAKNPLFTTEDGVDIFEGDEYFELALTFKPQFREAIYECTGRSNIIYDYNTLEGKKKLNEMGRYYFSTKEAAEEYIIFNNPCLSINDIIELARKLLKNQNAKLDEKSINKLKELVKSK